MKEVFETPTLDVIAFETADIITTSPMFNNDTTGDGPKIKW